jgi:VanZ family protein
MPERKTIDRIQRLARRARTLAIVYFAVLFIGTHLPDTTTSQPNVWDKGLHFSGYAALAVFVLACWELAIGRLQPRHYFAVWLAGIVYGAFDEWTQTSVGRTCDMNDWAADVLGVTSGIVIYQLLRPLMFAILGRDDATAR